MVKKFLPIISILIVMFVFVPATYASSSENVLTSAKKQLGVPYRYGGTSPNGFDCSGFVQYVYKQHGISLPRTTGTQFQVGKAVSKSELQVGDLVFFQTYQPGPSHVGIYAGNSQFIHASSSKGVTFSSINDPHYYAPRYLGARRVLPDEAEQLKKAIAALPEGHFLDVEKDHWAFTSIKQLSKDGIMSGVKEGFFMPDETVTRAQAAAIIAKVKGLNVNEGISTFADVSDDHWAKNAISAVTDAGYFEYTTNFEPNRALTRAEAADVISKAFSLTASDYSAEFTDVHTNHWAHDSIVAVANYNIMSGYEDQSFKPNEKITRAQLANVIFSAIQ